MWRFYLALLTLLGCGLIGGVFFAFSTFVMKALARLPSAQGIAAMQSINVAVINPLFMGAFLGTGAACAVLAISSVLNWRTPGALGLLVGGLLYLVGTILVTIIFNVPLNNALAKVDPGSSDAAALWAAYVSNWTIWNHVRTTASLVAAASFAAALCQRS